jgi:peptidoglycan/LPS O-acetylase OafA/YrhL
MDGRASGFDYLRIGLAISIIAAHSCLTSYGLAANDALYAGAMGRVCNLLVPMFFALSGYLVAGSLDRSRTLIIFLGHRAIRILPALIVEVVFSALILGPILTNLPLHSYFTDPLLFKYMLNVIGEMHYLLPGVFVDNPWPLIVNAQLWTIPYELYCYAVLAAIALLGVKKRPILAPSAALAITISYCFWVIHASYAEIILGTNGVRKPFLVVIFLIGVSLYFYRHLLPWSKWSGLAALSVSIALPGLGQYSGFLAPIPVAYATVCLGLMNPSRKLLRGADYSYGIYLYGFVIQQTIMDVIPAFRVWYLNVLVSVPLAVMMAAASWHFVERPLGGLRVPLQRFDRFLANKIRSRRGIQPQGAIP